MSSSPTVLSPTSLLAANPRLHLPSSTLPPSETNPPIQKTWLVFGATGHIGRSIVKAALSHGDNVAAVGRTMENSMAQMQGWGGDREGAGEGRGAPGGGYLGLLCDVRVRETVEAVLRRCVERFGGVDVVVNCSGYGVIASCEDQDTCDLRSQFETNFLGTLNIIQLTLPYFRAQASRRQERPSSSSQHLQPSSPTGSSDDAGATPGGRFLIFSSTSGSLGVPGLGPYCATKYATEGLIESMLYEIDAFGIKATLVEPGHVRLDEPTGLDDKTFMTQPPGTGAGEGHKISQLKRYGHFFLKPPSKAYSSPTAPSGHARRVVQWLADKQPTSAVKSAELVWQLGHCKYPPLRLLLGSFAIESVRDRLRSIIEEIEDWKHLHFPGGEEGQGKGKGRRGEEGEEEEDEGMEGEEGEEAVKEEKEEEED